MTIEEAGEIVLRAEPFTPCGDCMGQGFYERIIGGVSEVEVCTLCKASGMVLVPEYEKACEVLGRPIPKLSHSKKLGYKKLGYQMSRILQNANNLYFNGKAPALEELVRIDHEEDEPRKGR